MVARRYSSPLLILAAFFPLFLICCSRNSTETYSAFTFFTMDTMVEVTYRGQSNSLEQSIQSEFERIYQAYTPSSKDNLLSEINASDGQPVPVDPETVHLIHEAIQISMWTQGTFDISVQPLLRLWGFNFDQKKVTIPGEDELLKALSSVGYQKIQLSEHSVTLPVGGGIDLGGIAKGYAVDRAADIFFRHGVEDFLINAGGDLRAGGLNSRGTEWVIGIQHPRSEGLITTTTLKNRALVTSGDYQRFVDIDGVRYHHILDPQTGLPFRIWTSMTVTAPSCMTADALATGLFGMTEEEIRNVIKEHHADVTFLGVTQSLNLISGP